MRISRDINFKIKVTNQNVGLGVNSWSANHAEFQNSWERIFMTLQRGSREEFSLFILYLLALENTLLILKDYRQNCSVILEINSDNNFETSDTHSSMTSWLSWYLINFQIFILADWACFILTDCFFVVVVEMAIAVLSPSK